ncbi:MAG: Glu-tRNA(Gln) amidotransferase subunit GatD [Candidatus Electryonea clarkiae]|nr:Glu-tRNA(Gln) amidotransferase subunit GatD [Candidatus Electryonea clarkiae]MDP8286446.1 Glu-tRNA(Gln) amidotransferase subunit GatD [Candidatus Electryonea clarkiae]
MNNETSIAQDEILSPSLPPPNPEEDYKGYKGHARKLLEEKGARVWCEVVLETTSGDFPGILLPRTETSDDRHLVIKLTYNGYNVGIAVDTITSIKILGYRKANYQIPEKEFPFNPGMPDVVLLGTGGTIASRLDYRTGAVIPAFSPGELYGAVPELADICNLSTRKLYGEFSENIGPPHWMGLAKEIKKEIENGVAGVVVGHGTDTMHYTAAALTFMIQNLPVPVVIVGSQRSSDRPSSDAAYNLIRAVNTAATGDFGEVMICMFGPTSDYYDLLHRGTRVRKMHSSYRSAFRTISDVPIARVDDKGFHPIKHDDAYRHRDHSQIPELDAVFDERVSIVWYYPNMQPDVINSLIDNGYKGIIIAGTGLGHVNKPLYPAIKRGVEAGVQFFMTVQTLWGYVQMFVYDTGRDIMELGVTPLANMLPEVAYVKLGWVLGHTHEPAEVKRMMLKTINGEITEREPIDGYLVMQGGLPELDDYFKRFQV